MHQLGDAGPRLLSGRAQELADAVELLGLVPPWLDWLAQQQLSKDAADGPHVDGGAIDLRSQQEFRWSVPQRDDTVRVCLLLIVKGPSQAKVGQLELPLIVDEEIRPCQF